MTTTITHQDYLRRLERWPSSCRRFLYSCPDRPDLECYGTGYSSWGVQTNQKALAAFAVLAADPDFDERRAEMTRDELLRHALKMFRFALESHKVGSYHCLDGPRWGLDWISALGTERMMHGVEAIREHLNRKDHELLRAVMLAESDVLLDHYVITAGKVRNNHPESNMWNGALLHRTAALYPDAPRAAEYREKGALFLVNAISVASDATSNLLLDGKRVADLYVGDNFFESFACNRHGYLNIGYMVICLSNAAMLHFMYRTNGLTPPESLYHHVKDLFHLVKLCTAPDGRLIRIGGDTRVPYCYCQDYVIPMWLMMADRFGDADCPGLEMSWLQQIEKETTANNDGSFLSARCGHLQSRAPVYYTRLESDRAVTLSMGAYWRRVLSVPSRTNTIDDRCKLSGSWHEPYHGAFLQRGSRRIASWAWRAAEPPEGLCVPTDESSLAEWRNNCSGFAAGVGAINSALVTGDCPVKNPFTHDGRPFDGGFITWGKFGIVSQGMLEGMQDHTVALMQVALAALPDDRTVMVMQYATAPDARVYLNSVRGLFLRIPNDVFNGNYRTYHTAGGSIRLQGVNSREDIVDTESAWINVDDRLGAVRVYGPKTLSIFRPGKRQLGIRNTDTGMLFADEICSPCLIGLRSVDPGTVLFDIGFVIQANVSHSETTEYVQRAKYVPFVCPDQALIRAMIAEGADGKEYLLAANFGQKAATMNIRLPHKGKATCIVTNTVYDVSSGSTFSIDVGACSAMLFSVE